LGRSDAQCRFKRLDAVAPTECASPLVAHARAKLLPRGCRPSPGPVGAPLSLSPSTDLFRTRVRGGFREGCSGFPGRAKKPLSIALTPAAS
jgi:hypothetical protein